MLGEFQEPAIGIAAALYVGFTKTPAKEVADLVAGDDAEPAAKRVISRLVPESVDVGENGLKDLLKNIRSILRPNSRSATPGIDQWRV